MTLPNVKTTLTDRKNRVTYHILAYRALTRAELMLVVRLYLAQKRKRPRPGTSVTIISIIGHDE